MKRESEKLKQGSLLGTAGVAETSENMRAPVTVKWMNPDWTEWLMGWPINWTALKPLETDKFQQWLSSHGKR
jgi:hypothetical protein